jgi:hypothetical protein
MFYNVHLNDQSSIIRKKRIIVTHFSVIYYHENYLIVKRKTYDQHQKPFLRLELHMYKIYRIIVSPLHYP